MSPKNARLEINGDQSSSVTIQTDAIIGAEVNTDELESIPELLLVGKFAGYTAPWILEFITRFVFEINIVAMASTSRTQISFANILKERFKSFIF